MNDFTKVQIYFVIYVVLLIVLTKNFLPILFKKVYYFYSGIKIGYQGKKIWLRTKFTERVERLRCLSYMARKKSLPFAIPMASRQMNNHTEISYFCMIFVVGFNSKNKEVINYPSLLGY